MTRRIVSTPGVQSGWPCFEGTRIPYDTVLRLVDHDTIHPNDVPRYYPSLGVDAWLTAARYAVELHLTLLDK